MLSEKVINYIYFMNTIIKFIYIYMCVISGFEENVKEKQTV